MRSRTKAEREVPLLRPLQGPGCVVQKRVSAWRSTFRSVFGHCRNTAHCCEYSTECHPRLDSGLFEWRVLPLTTQQCVVLALFCVGSLRVWTHCPGAGNTASPPKGRAAGTGPAGIPHVTRCSDDVPPPPKGARHSGQHVEGQSEATGDAGLRRLGVVCGAVLAPKVSRFKTPRAPRQASRKYLYRQFAEWRDTPCMWLTF